ncbi:hypothetical protein [Microcoleus sp. B9-D4]
MQLRFQPPRVKCANVLTSTADRTFVDLSLSRTYSQINLKQSDLISISN